MSKPSDDLDADVWSSRSHPVQEHMGYQRLEWSLERIGWYVLCGLIVLALLGLFSRGPLSRTTAATPTGEIRIEYERFNRNGASTNMRLRVDADPGQEVAVLLGSAFMQAFTVETIQPEPIQARSGNGGVELIFRATKSGPLTVYLGLRPEGIGLVRSEINLNDREPIRLTQFVYP